MVGCLFPLDGNWSPSFPVRYDCISYVQTTQVHVYLSGCTMLGKKETRWLQTEMCNWDVKATEPNWSTSAPSDKNCLRYPDECKPKVCHQLSSWLWSITTTSQTYHYFQTTHRTQIESFQLRLHCKDMSDPRPFKAPSPTSPSKRFPKLSRPRKVDWGCGV